MFKFIGRMNIVLIFCFFNLVVDIILCIFVLLNRINFICYFIFLTFIYIKYLTNTSFEDPPSLELKELPKPFCYGFLNENGKLPIILASNLTEEQGI